MKDSLELAIFRGDDDPSLVAAALACRACLSGEVEWSLRVDDFEGDGRVPLPELRVRSRGFADLGADAAPIARAGVTIGGGDR